MIESSITLADQHHGRNPHTARRQNETDSELSADSLLFYRIFSYFTQLSLGKPKFRKNSSTGKTYRRALHRHIKKSESGRRIACQFFGHGSHNVLAVQRESEAHFSTRHSRVLD